MTHVYCTDKYLMEKYWMKETKYCPDSNKLPDNT